MSFFFFFFITITLFFFSLSLFSSFLLDYHSNQNFKYISNFHALTNIMSSLTFFSCVCVCMEEAKNEEKKKEEIKTMRESFNNKKISLHPISLSLRSSIDIFSRDFFLLFFIAIYICMYCRTIKQFFFKREREITSI